MSFDRRRFLQLSGACGVAGILPVATGLAPDAARAATSITGVSYLTPSYKALSYGSQGFVERLKAAAPADVAIDYYDSGKLLKADEQLPALRSGTIDFMFHTTSYITRSVPILGITGMPGVVEALYEHPERLAMGSPLFELVNEQLAKDDLLMLSMGGGILQPEYLWSTAKSPIRSIADIEGKKVRVVSYEATRVMESFGAGAVRIPSSELYLAMQRGTVDAAVANISTIIGRSIQEETATLYELPITGFAIGVFVNAKRWDKVDDGVKDAMENRREVVRRRQREACEREDIPRRVPAHDRGAGRRDRAGERRGHGPPRRRRRARRRGLEEGSRRGDRHARDRPGARSGLMDGRRRNATAPRTMQSG